MTKRKKDGWNKVRVSPPLPFPFGSGPRGDVMVG